MAKGHLDWITCMVVFGVKKPDNIKTEKKENNESLQSALLFQALCEYLQVERIVSIPAEKQVKENVVLDEK